MNLGDPLDCLTKKPDQRLVHEMAIRVPATGGDYWERCTGSGQTAQGGGSKSGSCRKGLGPLSLPAKKPLTSMKPC